MKLLPGQTIDPNKPYTPAQIAELCGMSTKDVYRTRCKYGKTEYGPALTWRRWYSWPGANWLEIMGRQRENKRKIASRRMKQYWSRVRRKA